MLRTAYVETSYHFVNMYTTLFVVLHEELCFKFLDEFKYLSLELGQLVGDHK